MRCVCRNCSRDRGVTLLDSHVENATQRSQHHCVSASGSTLCNFSVHRRRPLLWRIAVFQYEDSVFNTKIPHVCSEWRHVALACPTLWTRLYFSNYSSDWMAELMSRSQQALLDLGLHVAGNTRVDWTGFGRALQDIHRVQQLLIEINSLSDRVKSLNKL